MSTQPNGNGQQPQQPDPQIIIGIQQQEINRLNDNRIYLMALIEEIQQKAQVEVAKLSEEVSKLKASKVTAKG